MTRRERIESAVLGLATLAVLAALAWWIIATLWADPVRAQTPTQTPTKTPGPTIAAGQCCQCAGPSCGDYTTLVGAICQASSFLGATPTCGLVDNAICFPGGQCATWTPTNTPTRTRTNTFTPTPTETPGPNCAIWQMTNGFDGVAENDCAVVPTPACITGQSELVVERDNCGPLDYQQQAIMEFNTMGVIPVGSTITSGFLRVASDFSTNGDSVNVQGDWIGGSDGCSPSDYSDSAGSGAFNVPLATACPSGCCPIGCGVAQSIDFPLGGFGSIADLVHPRLRVHLSGPAASSNIFSFISYDGDVTFNVGAPREALGLCWNPPATDTPGGVSSPTRTPTPSFTPTGTPTRTFTLTPTPTLTATCPPIVVMSPLPSPAPAGCGQTVVTVDRTIPVGNWVVFGLASGHIARTVSNGPYVTLAITDTKSNPYVCTCNTPDTEVPPLFPLASCICYGDLTSQLDPGDLVTITHDTDCDLVVWSLEITDAPCGITTTSPAAGFGECVSDMHAGACFPDQAPYTTPEFCATPPPGVGCGHPGCVICCTPQFGTMEFAPLGQPALQLDHISLLPTPSQVPCDNVPCGSGCGDFTNTPTNWPCCHKGDPLCDCNDGLGCFNFATSYTRQLSVDGISFSALCFANFDATTSGNFHMAVSAFAVPDVPVTWIQRTDCGTTDTGCGGTGHYSPTLDRQVTGPVSETVGDASWDFVGQQTNTTRKSIMKFSAPSNLPKQQGMFLPTPGVPWVEHELGLFRGLPLGVPTNTPVNTPTPSETATETPTKTPAICCVAYTPTVTPTPTITATPTATPICTTVSVIGTVHTATGELAVNRRVSFEIRHTEVVNECIIRPSIQTWITDSQGRMPPDATAIGGSIDLVTIENGVASEVLIPTSSPVDIAQLLGQPLPIPVDSVSGVHIGPGGEFTLFGTLPFGYGILTLTPGPVTGFTLTDDADGGGHKIVQLDPHPTLGQALSVGAPAGGALAGTFPNVTLAKPQLAGAVPIPLTLVPGLSCVTVTPAVTGARTGMVAAVSPEGDPGPFTWTASIPMNDMVQVDVCALVAAPLPPLVWDVRVIQ